MSLLIRSLFFILICVASIVLGNFYKDYQTLFMILTVVSFASFGLTLASELKIDL